MSGTVQNVGSALRAGQTSTLAYYLSSDTVLDGRDVLLGTRTVPGLGAAATSPGSTTVTMPALPVGSYFVIARADDGDVIAEARENNNTRATVATIVVGPDVAVTVATGPAGVVAGRAVTISNTVQNKGPVAASFTVGFYLSSDDVLDGGDVPLGTRTVTSLGAGAASAAATVLTIPANTAPGAYRVIVRADDAETLGEVDETNNVKATGPLTVTAP